MRYIAKKNEDKFTITGIKEMMTIDGDMVEVEFASKEYDKTQLEETLKAYTEEKLMVIDKYDTDITDMNNILTAINSAE